jgi:hypothetical protein
VSFRAALLALAAGSLAAGCTSPTTGVADPPRGPAWKDAGTPVTSTVPGREMRYYKDENGILWDDRGKKRDNLL